MRAAVVISAAISFAAMYTSNAARAELICLHPVPLTIKELTDKHKAGLISEEVLDANSDYLTLRYCAVTNGELAAVSGVPLGDGCDMKWGYRLGELVYWSVCATQDQTQVRPAPLKQQKPRTSQRGSSLAAEISCCIRKMNRARRPGSGFVQQSWTADQVVSACRYIVPAGNRGWCSR